MAVLRGGGSEGGGAEGGGVCSYSLGGLLEGIFWDGAAAHSFCSYSRSGLKRSCLRVICAIVRGL